MRRLPTSRVPELAALAALSLSTLATAQDVLVSSRFTDEVLRYDGDTGAFLGVFAAGGGLDNPVGLAFGPDGRLYVASGDTDQVLRYDGATGAFVDVIVSGGTLDGPREIGFGPDGMLYVAGGASDEVLRFDPATGASLGVVASGFGLDGPTGFALSVDGTIYVVSVLTNEILRFDVATGQHLATFAPPELDGPHDLAFGPDGLLYVTNSFGSPRKVIRLDPDTGAFRGVFVDAPVLSFPLGMAWTPAGELLVANQGRDRVNRFDAATGALLGAFVPAGSGGLDGPLFLTLMPRAGGPALRLPPAGTAGSEVNFWLDGAAPGADVWVLFGPGAGSTPFAPCPGLLLDVASPRALAHALADGSGGLLVRRPVPAVLAGTTLVLQAVDGSTCLRSPVVRYRP